MLESRLHDLLNSYELTLISHVYFHHIFYLRERVKQQFAVELCEVHEGRRIRANSSHLIMEVFLYEPHSDFQIFIFISLIPNDKNS